jgi:hypothetical protein
MSVFKSKKRYAFVDVQNTASTTRKLLGFIIDWRKLYAYLTDKWKCEKVFYYSGIDEGDDETAKEFESTRLKDIIKKHEQGKIDLINIDSWKMKIRKEV